jgi:transcriptional regulator with XRE-family HTH domain
MGTRQTPKRPPWSYDGAQYLKGHQQRLARNNPAAPSRNNPATHPRVIASPGATGVLSEDRRGTGNVCPRSPEVQAEIDAADAQRKAENLARDRAATQNPIGPDEVTGLERLGALIRGLRQEAGLSIVELAVLADRDSSYLTRIERGSRRARVNTLEAIAAALASRGVGTEQELIELFAGHPVASESAWPGWPERMAAKKKRRQELDASRHPQGVG